MGVVSAGTVSGDISRITDQIKDYDTQIGRIGSDWEGASHDKLISEANSFSSEVSKISTGMTDFMNACSAYQEYLDIKDDIKVYESNVAEAKRCDDSEGLSKYQGLLSEAKTNLDAKKSEIEKYLSSASSVKISGNSSPALSGGGTFLSNPTGIANQLGGDSGVLPNARIGDSGRPDPSTNMFFQNEANGGINGFPLNGGGPGKGGNCTYYAYSRFSELLGKEATGLASGDACSWYANTKGYKKGSTPKLGAIAVWQYGNSSSNGHVAVVEEIKENGDIVVSEGGWSSQKWYGNNTYKKSNDYATGYSNGHLLGFIYPEEA